MTNFPNSADNQSTLNYCINKAIPDGSNLYYASLFDKKNKPRIVSLHALLNELSDVVYECADPGVARIKLKWWQEEILRLKDEKPGHPVTKQLLDNYTWNKLNIESLLNAIENFEQFISLEQPETLTSILNLYKSSYGSIWKIYAKQSGLKEAEILNQVEETGAIYHYLISLQQAHTFITDTRCIVPAAYLKHVTLLNLKYSDATQNVEQQNAFKQLIHDLANQLNENYPRLKNINHDCLQHILISNRLAIKIADEMKPEGLELLNKSIGLTPIRKLWIAWRTNLSLR